MYVNQRPTNPPKGPKGTQKEFEIKPYWIIGKNNRNHVKGSPVKGMGWWMASTK